MVERHRNRWLNCCCGRSENDGAIVTHGRLPLEMGVAKGKGVGNEEEDDLEAVRSWREQRNTSSALVIVNVEPKLHRIDEGDETSFSLPPPVEEIEEVPPASPVNLSMEQTIPEENFSHLSGGFPTFTPEEEEWRQHHAQLKDAYLSSSSASTSSTVEDPVLRRSPVAGLDESFDTGAEGPVDLDQLDDHLLLNTSFSRRPEPDDGDLPPTVSSITHSNDTGGASKDSASLDWKNMDLIGLHNSSEELDAMVAAIDHGLEATTRNASSPVVKISPCRKDSPHIFDPLFVAETTPERDSSPTESARHRRQTRRRVAKDVPLDKPVSFTASARDLPSDEFESASLPHFSVEKPTPTREPKKNVLAKEAAVDQPTPPRELQNIPSKEATVASLFRHVDRSHPAPHEQRNKLISDPPVTVSPPKSASDIWRKSPQTVLKEAPSETLVPIPLMHRDVNTSDDPSGEFGASRQALDRAEDDEDRLSNIPSEADPLQTERYLKACRILKMALLQKEPMLPASDQQFLTQLLLETTPSKDSSDLLTEDRVKFYESAAQHLRASPPLMDNATSIVSTDGGAQNAKWVGTDDDMAIPPPYQLPLVTERELQMHDHRFMASNMSERSTPSQVSSSLFSRMDQDDYPFQWIGDGNRHSNSSYTRPQVLTSRLMGALRGFLPDPLRGHNFWWKFAWDARDPPPVPQPPASNLQLLLEEIQFSPHSIFSVETVDGHVFGAICSSPWQIKETWFGSEDCFLWRLKHPRNHLLTNAGSEDNEMEIYPYTCADGLIQYCTPHALAVGGGTDWSLFESGCPYGKDEPTGIGFLLDGDLMGGETSACTTFANPRLGNRGSGGNEFDIRYLEVWTLTPCSSVAEAQELEMAMLQQEADQRTSSDF